jgi:hypothetical protein
MGQKSFSGRTLGLAIAALLLLSGTYMLLPMNIIALMLVFGMVRILCSLLEELSLLSYMIGGWSWLIWLTPLAFLM